MSALTGWTTKPLSQVVDLQRGFDLPHHARRPGPYPVLTSGEGGGWHDEGPIKGPGVTVGRATNLGQPKWSEGDFWPHNTTMFVKDFKGNNPRWVYHLFEATDLTGYDSGSVQPMLNRNYISQVPVLVPPIQVQQAISEVLGALDVKVAANDRVVAIADELARAQFLASLDVGGDPRTVALGDLAAAGALELGDGYRTKRSEHGQDGFRIVRAGEVSGGRIDLTGPDFVAADYERRIGRKVVKSGDVVLTTKGTVGRVAVVPDGVERATYSPQLCYFRATDRDRLNPAYLAGWFKSDDLQAQIAVRMFKSDMAPYVNLQDVRSLAIPLPSIDVQRQIGQRQGALQQLAHASHRESSRLAAVRDELLPLLMSGKVRVKEAEKTVEGVL